MTELELLNKLVAQNEKHGSIIVAYDFDDTVYPYSVDVETLKPTVNIIKKLHEAGHKVYCYTSNEDIYKVTSYLHYNNIPFYSINKSPVDSKGKQFYNVLLDDKAGLNETLSVLKMFLTTTRGE